MTSSALIELKAALRARYGARLAELVLFGSRARGDAAADSDLDLLVVLRGEVDADREIRATGAEVAAISLRHDCVLVCSFMPESAWRGESSPALLNIRREGVPV